MKILAYKKIKLKLQYMLFIEPKVIKTHYCMNVTDMITKATQVLSHVDLEILPQFLGRTGSLFSQYHHVPSAILCL